ncbi:MAG: exosortase-associated EpsI family protein [Myxococcales bacterium]|nr:exosortase-associated EpsI family protein [Myxococcales bacterium]
MSADEQRMEGGLRLAAAGPLDPALFAWLALLLFAHRATLGLEGVHATADPIERFFFEAGSTVPLLHYAVFALIVWRRRLALAGADLVGREGQGTSPYARRLSGGLVMLLGAGLVTWGRATGQLDLLLDALVLSIAGGALWRGGSRLLSRFLLPLAVLWLARPLPPFWVHALHEWLQTWTGLVARLALSPFDAVVQSGHLMGFRGHVFQVIEGCSGLRSTLTLVFATLLYADLFSRSRVQTVGLVGLAGVIGLLVNGLRVIWIMIAPGSTLSEDHSMQGLVMIVLGIVLLATIDVGLDRRVWPRGDRSWRLAGAALSPRPTLARLGRDRWWGPLALASVLAVASCLPLDLERPRPEIWRLHEIGNEIGAWRAVRVLEADYRHLGSVDFRDKVHREYEREGEHVKLFVGSDDRIRRDQSLLSPKTLTEGSGWEVEEIRSVRVRGFAVPVDRVLARREGERAVSLHVRLGAGGPLAESLRWWLALDLRPGRSPAEIAVVRVTAPVRDGDRVGATHVAEAFLRDLAPVLDRAAPASLGVALAEPATP